MTTHDLTRAFPEAFRDRTPGRRRALALSALAAVALIAFVELAPRWVQILAVLAAVTAASLAATRPADTTLRRHVAAYAGQVFLDAIKAVLVTVVRVAVALLLLAAAWGWVEPQVTAWIGHTVHATTAAVTPHVSLPAIHWPWSKKP